MMLEILRHDVSDAVCLTFSCWRVVHSAQDLVRGIVVSKV
jgi:hypothetical protein